MKKNRILSRISVAAQTALAHPKSVELIHFIGAGPSIRARARLSLIAVFLVVSPILFIGVMKTEKVGHHASSLNEYDDYWRLILQLRIDVKELSLSTWAYSVEPEFENAQSVLAASHQLKQGIFQMAEEKPKELDIGPEGFLMGLVSRLDALLKRSVANQGSMAQARLSIISMANELENVEIRIIDMANREKKAVMKGLPTVARDQLILFLILLFAIPVFIGFIPDWLVSPLSRLRQILNKMDLGQLKSMPLTGRDEVAMLARSLKNYFLRKEDLDHKKSSKIFEMRNVLRSVINRVSEPIFIIDEQGKINYTNESAAVMLGAPIHQMEGKLISDCMYSADIKKAADRAFKGDISKEDINIDVETSDGRNLVIKSKLGIVRNRDGDISRAVIVFYD